MHGKSIEQTESTFVPHHGAMYPNGVAENQKGHDDPIQQNGEIIPQQMASDWIQRPIEQNEPTVELTCGSTKK